MTNSLLRGPNLSRPREQYNPFNGYMQKNVVDGKGSIAVLLNKSGEMNLSTIATALPGYLAAYSRLYHVLKDDYVNFGGWGKLEDGSYLVESPTLSAAKFNALQAGDSLTGGFIDVRIHPDGTMEGIVTDADGSQRPYVIETKQESETDAVAVVFAMMVQLCFGKVSNASIQKVMQDFAGTIEEGAILFCDNFRLLVQYDKQIQDICGEVLHTDALKEAELPLLKIEEPLSILEQKGTLRLLAEKEKENGVESRKKEEYGDITQLAGQYAPTSGYDPHGTEACPALIPSDEALAGYQITKETIQICEDIRDDSEARNFLLRGDPGTGKTEMCKMIAKLCGLSYRIFSCGDSMTDLDLKMQIIPNDQAPSGETLVAFQRKVPSPITWALDPEGAYQEMTGKEKKGANPEDCFAAAMAQYQKVVAKHASGFKYVYSSIIESFKYGGVTEIQELQLLPSGTAATMNSMLDSCKQVTLMSGEVIHRHPNCVLIFTTNAGLYGLNRTNQSVLSRCDIYDISLPETAKVLKRLERASGYHNMANLRKMLLVCKACKAKAIEKSITDGAIDFRALNAWAREMAIHPERGLYETGRQKLISKCTEDVELQIRYFVPCLESQFCIGE